MTTPSGELTRAFQGLDIPPAGTYVIDQSFSHVGFVVRHLMVSKVRGSFRTFSGSVMIDEDPTSAALEVSIDVGSVDTGDRARDEQTCSEAFFDVAEYPTMRYHSASAKVRDDGTWVVEGDLTLHGVTRPVPLEVVFEGAAVDPRGRPKFAFSAGATISRDDFGLTWNVPLDGGGVAVGKKVTVEIEAQLVSG